MNIFRQNGNNRGQGLIELTVILPLLVLFMTAAAPLIVRGISSLWIDERLTLRQFGIDDNRVQRILVKTHEADRLPTYFEENEIKEETWVSSLGVPIPLLTHRFPGKIRRKRATASLKKTWWWNRSILGHPQEKFFHLSRALSMVPVFDPGESGVGREIRNLTLLGIAPGKSDILEKVGLNLFHLNLDALPETARKRE